MSKTSTRAAIYTRISDDAEGKALGVARQEKDCRKLATDNGLTVVEVYSDNDISASTNSRTPRPNWERMLDDAESGRFEVILAYSASRLTRRPREAEDIIDLYDDVGVQPIMRGHRPDLSTADGRQLFRILCGMDAAEAERTSERARAKQKELAESGRHNGPRPFGWDIVGLKADQRLIVNAAEAAVLKECVERVLAGEGIWKIVNDLNARGIRTSTGRAWKTQVLRRVLLRPRNYGMRSHGPLGKNGKPKGKPQLYRGQWEPVIDQETHERVVALLTNPSRKTNNRGTQAKYLLTSVAYCGACGRHVVGTNEFTYILKNGRTRVYPHAYKCPHAGCMKVQRRMSDVDALVNGVVVGVLVRDGVRLLGGDPLAAEQARERIAALQAKLALNADMWSADEITDDQFQRSNNKLRPHLEAERAKLRNAQPDAALTEFADDDAAMVATAWKNADIETKKAIIRRLRMNITINPIGPGKGREFEPESVTIESPTA